MSKIIQASKLDPQKKALGSGLRLEPKLLTRCMLQIFLQRDAEAEANHAMKSEIRATTWEWVEKLP